MSPGRRPVFLVSRAVNGSPRFLAALVPGVMRAEGLRDPRSLLSDGQRLRRLFFLIVPLGLQDGNAPDSIGSALFDRKKRKRKQSIQTPE